MMTQKDGRGIRAHANLFKKPYQGPAPDTVFGVEAKSYPTLTAASTLYLSTQAVYSRSRSRSARPLSEWHSHAIETGWRLQVVVNDQG